MEAFLSRVFGSAIVEESATGLSIRTAPGRCIAWLIAFAVLLTVAWFLRRRRLGGNLAHGAFYTSFAIPLIIIPGIALESVHVSPSELTVRTGFWFAPTIQEIPLAGVESVSEHRRAVRQRALSRRDTYWSFRYGDGRERSLELPDLLAANRTAAADYLRRSGVRVLAE